MTEKKKRKIVSYHLARKRLFCMGNFLPQRRMQGKKGCYMFYNYIYYFINKCQWSGQFATFSSSIPCRNAAIGVLI